MHHVWHHNNNNHNNNNDKVDFNCYSWFTGLFLFVNYGPEVWTSWIGWGAVRMQGQIKEEFQLFQGGSWGGSDIWSECLMDGWNKTSKKELEKYKRTLSTEDCFLCAWCDVTRGMCSCGSLMFLRKQQTHKALTILFCRLYFIFWLTFAIKTLLTCFKI